jgi:hypothetical protein
VFGQGIDRSAKAIKLANANAAIIKIILFIKQSVYAKVETCAATSGLVAV